MIKKICIIEDDQALQHNIMKKLVNAGFDVTSGEDADLFIVDLSIHGKMSWDLIKQLRKNVKVPIIVYSGFSAIKYKQKALELGVNGYYDKGFSPDDLIMNIKYTFSLFELGMKLK